MNCPLCKDIKWFSTEGWVEYKELWHNEAVKEADAEAKLLADDDEDTCSLTWEELWLHHFNKLVMKIYEQKKQKALSNFKNSVYENKYPSEEIKYICDYHAECYFV